MNGTMAVPNTNSELAPELRKGAKVVYKIRLLRGRHIDRQGVFDATAENKNYPPDDAKRFGRYSLRTFQADPKKGLFPVFESTKDLTDNRTNPPGYPPKYEAAEIVHTNENVDPTVRRPGETLHDFLTRMGEVVTQARAASESTLKSLDGLDLEQLRDLAESEEVDYTSCRTVEDFRKAIRGALAPQPSAPVPPVESKSPPSGSGKK